MSVMVTLMKLQFIMNVKFAYAIPIAPRRQSKQTETENLV